MFATSLWNFRRFFGGYFIHIFNALIQSTPKGLECFGVPVSPAYTAASSNSLGSKPPDVSKKFSQPIFFVAKTEKWLSYQTNWKRPGPWSKAPKFRCGFSVFGNGGPEPNSWIETTRFHLAAWQNPQHQHRCKTYFRVFEGPEFFTSCNLIITKQASCCRVNPTTSNQRSSKPLVFTQIPAPLLPNPQISWGCSPPSSVSAWAITSHPRKNQQKPWFPPSPPQHKPFGRRTGRARSHRRGSSLQPGTNSTPGKLGKSLGKTLIRFMTWVPRTRLITNMPMPTLLLLGSWSTNSLSGRTSLKTLQKLRACMKALEKTKKTCWWAPEHGALKFRRLVKSH